MLEIFRVPVPEFVIVMVLDSCEKQVWFPKFKSVVETLSLGSGLAVPVPDSKMILLVPLLASDSITRSPLYVLALVGANVIVKGSEPLAAMVFDDQLEENPEGHVILLILSALVPVFDTVIVWVPVSPTMTLVKARLVEEKLITGFCSSPPVLGSRIPFPVRVRYFVPFVALDVICSFALKSATLLGANTTERVSRPFGAMVFSFQLTENGAPGSLTETLRSAVPVFLIVKERVALSPCFLSSNFNSVLETSILAVFSTALIPLPLNEIVLSFPALEDILIDDVKSATLLGEKVTVTFCEPPLGLMVPDVQSIEYTPPAPLRLTVKLAEPVLVMTNDAVDFSPTFVSAKTSDVMSTEIAGFFTSSVVVNLVTLP